ncbi:MAG: glycosyltransferase family 8 protein [Selenomonadaceae bacterium]|nr:glycosyltransferase family 8 protein [Selenomonadaceae bacterium]
MIHVCFGLNDKNGTYSKFTGTTMASIFENTTSNVTIHILHDDTLTLDNREKFSYLAGQYNQLVKFYNVDELCKNELQKIVRLFPTSKNHYATVGMFYRFFFSKLLSADIDKCIYLDSDIIVNLDLNELWKVDLGDKVLGVIPECSNGLDTKEKFALCHDNFVAPEDYFNSGVLLMNLEAFRAEEEKILRAMKFIGENPKYIFLDQDVLNYCFAARTLKLPLKFNRFVIYARIEREPVALKKIYHFAGGGLGIDMRDPFNRLWMSHFMKTPWFNLETVGRLYAGFQQIHVGLKNSMIQISAAMSGKTRAFFTTPENVDALKKIFLVRDGEEILRDENQSSLKKLIDAMKKSRGKKIFIILVPNFPFRALTEVGFVHGRDFLNGMDFLSEAQGLPMNSHLIIRAM